MGKVVRLENARQVARIFYVYYQNSTYLALDASRMTKTQAINLLPTPTPNFIQQTARSADEAIQRVKDLQAETLLSSPL